MPEYPFLFDVLENPQPVPNRAVQLPEEWAERPTWILPNQRGIQLVEYLLSLDRNYPVPEAP
jgi:cytochrome c oxidase cbb3-type subunit 2